VSYHRSRVFSVIWSPNRFSHQGPRPQMILCMLLTQTHRSASTIVSHWFGPLVQNASWGGSGASVGPCPLYLESCGVKGTSPPPLQYERLLLKNLARLVCIAYPIHMTCVGAYNSKKNPHQDIQSTQPLHSQNDRHQYSNARNH
jgi:hypothetical protein